MKSISFCLLQFPKEQRISAKHCILTREFEGDASNGVVYIQDMSRYGSTQKNGFQHTTLPCIHLVPNLSYAFVIPIQAMGLT